MDRRYSSTLSQLSLDNAYVDKILDMVRETALDEGSSRLAPHMMNVLILTTTESGVTERTEEKAVVKLAVAYGVLRRLGFSEPRVEECLRSIRGIGLDEAYNWVGCCSASRCLITSYSTSYTFIVLKRSCTQTKVRLYYDLLSTQSNLFPCLVPRT